MEKQEEVGENTKHDKAEFYNRFWSQLAGIIALKKAIRKVRTISDSLFQ